MSLFFKSFSEIHAGFYESYLMSESESMALAYANLEGYEAQQPTLVASARQLIDSVRAKHKAPPWVDALMCEYDLTSEEGLMLMSLAEALLRIPDSATVDKLIEDKLTSADWLCHAGNSGSAWVNLATQGLSIGHKMVGSWHSLFKKMGRPFLRSAVRRAMQVMSRHFVHGSTIAASIKRSAEKEKIGYRHSYDMLGEVARTQEDADRYFKGYQDAIFALAQPAPATYSEAAPTVSVKLSALHPRYGFFSREVMLPALIERVTVLATAAKKGGVTVMIDAEEADRLSCQLEVFHAVLGAPALAGWQGLGLAVQAYQRRALVVLDQIIHFARQYKKRIPVRLVKGAYWDSEIKQAQQNGWPDYPVFTRKVNTDVCFLACAYKMLSAYEVLHPKFATHNVYSVVAVVQRALQTGVPKAQFEFQSLHGMGAALHDHICQHMGVPCRIYAPVGPHEALLPYLVRRLLENGANSSFVHQLQDLSTPVEVLVRDPVLAAKACNPVAHPDIPLPIDLFRKYAKTITCNRANAQGYNFFDLRTLERFKKGWHASSVIQWQASVAGAALDPEQAIDVTSPYDHEIRVGQVWMATKAQAQAAVVKAQHAFELWSEESVGERAACLERAADLIESQADQLFYLLVVEAGKTWPDAEAEIRETVDFCRYYAQLARQTLGEQVLPGPTGEHNTLHAEGRGPMLCISPWNFPAAIFTGQIAAALVAGNTVVAKPANQTPLIAAKIVALFHQAHVPKDALQLMPGAGSIIGQQLVDDPRIQGVMLTGSNQTAQTIMQSLVQRPGPMVPLVAETGGINAMWADSTALPEQLVADVIASAFQSAGQRCSALRLLCLQDEIADTVLVMLKGAMQALTIGDPKYLATDVGPVIDPAARQVLQAHIEAMDKQAQCIYRCSLPKTTATGSFVAPVAYELASIDQLTEEVFGPVLHVVRYPSNQADAVIDQINALGYGLTFGIHTRIQSVAKRIAKRVRAGNVYVNRNMIGAVVGVQPFGGMQLSGTGPKAGGPHYLQRLVVEKSISIDTTAAGGNASLLLLDE